MQYAGSLIGMPFSIEGFAFFTEAFIMPYFPFRGDRFINQLGTPNTVPSA